MIYVQLLLGALVSVIIMCVVGVVFYGIARFIAYVIGGHYD